MKRVRKTKEERKKEIRNIAFELFVEKGFSSTTMEDVVNATSLSKGGVYHHYKNTTDMLYDLFMIDAKVYRDIAIENYMKKNKNLKREELLVNMFLDKLFDSNKYKEIYFMFLSQIRTNDKLRELYFEISKRGNKEFGKYAKENNIYEYAAISNKAIEFFINSIYLGVHIIPDFNENKEEIIEMCSIFIKAYLKNKLKERKEDEIR